MNVQHLCRACLATNKQMHPIFNNKDEVDPINVAELLQTFVESPILPTDNGSHNICDDCLQKLRDIHTFKLQCKQSERAFQQLSESRVRVKRLKDPREYLEFVIDVGMTEFPVVTQDENFQGNENTVHVGFNGMEGTVQPICDLTLDSENEIQSDVEETAEDILECPACLDAFGLVSVLRTHLLEVHTSESSCIMCDNEYFDDIWAHTKAHVPKKHACKDCGKKFVRGSTLEQHAQTHLLKPMLPCGHCGQCFLTETELDEHVTTTHSFLCKTCWKTFSTRRSLRRHQKIHLRVEEFQCQICWRRFKLKETYNSHMINHYNPSNESSAFLPDPLASFNPTEQNGMDMDENGSSVQHIDSAILDFLTVDEPPKITKSIEETKKHCCDICSKRFRDKASLAEHYTIHTGARPYACQYCDKTFRVKRNLKQHVISHSLEMPFNCGFCGQRFKKRQFIMAHLQQNHSSETSFPCGICDLKVRDPRELYRHWRFFHTVAYNDVQVVS